MKKQSKTRLARSINDPPTDFAVQGERHEGWCMHRHCVHNLNCTHPGHNGKLCVEQMLTPFNCSLYKELTEEELALAKSKPMRIK